MPSQSHANSSPPLEPSSPLGDSPLRILAAGLTPAWQQILRFSRFQLEEVNRAEESHWCASGKVINVGLALFHLAPRVGRTLSVVGGLAGNAIINEFVQHGASARLVRSGSPTRVCTTLLVGAGPTTELVENAAPIFPDELEEFVAAYAEEAAQVPWVVLSGSLPAGTPANFYRQLLELTPGQVIADVRGPELQAMLSAPRPPLVVKPNRQELAATLGRALDSDVQLIAGMRELNAAGAKWAIVTQGPSAVWLTSTDEVYRFTPPQLTAVNPIACGDCFAAGLALGLAEDRDISDAVRLAIGAASDNLTQLLPARLSPARVAEYAQQVRVERR